MTTPVDPVEPVPQTSDPVPAEVPVPVPSPAATVQDIADLATALQKAIADSVPEPPFHKATVTELTLPNITVQFPTTDGETPVDITDVRFLDSYSPVVGDTVLLVKQGTDAFALGQLNDSTQGGSDQGWLSLAGGVQYRMVIDNGDKKLQMKGSMSYATTLGTLDVDHRPSVTRAFHIGRNGQAGSILCQVSTAGVITLLPQGAMTSVNGVSGTGFDNNTDSTDTPAAAAGTTSSSGSHSHGIGHTHGGTTDVRLSGFLAANGSDLGHAHLISSGASSAGFSDTGTSLHTHTLGNHAHAGHVHSGLNGTLAHTHVVDPTDPTTVYFDGVEFFL